MTQSHSLLSYVLYRAEELPGFLPLSPSGCPGDGTGIYSLFRSNQKHGGSPAVLCALLLYAADAGYWQHAGEHGCHPHTTDRQQGDCLPLSQGGDLR